MITINSVRTLAAAALTCSCLAAPAFPAPGGPQPIASEQVDGTVLTVIPHIDYESAVLRVSGPDDYGLTKRFAAGMPIVADLLAEGEPTEGAAAATADAAQPQATTAGLAEGLYHYEVVFTDTAGERQLYTGTFVVEGGGLVSRPDKRIQLEAIRETLVATTEEFGRGPGVAEAGDPGAETTNVNDALFILDVEGDNFTFLELENAAGNDIVLSNFGGNLLKTTPNSVFLNAGLDLFLNSDDGNISLLSTGQVGINTTAPQRDLHVVAADPNSLASIRLERPSFVGEISVFSNGICIEGPEFANNANPFCVLENSGHGSLVVAADGVGVGTFFPAATLHVNGSGIIEGDVALGSSRTIKHDIEPLDAAGVLVAIRELPIYGWKYRDDPNQAPHVGPMAEDVHDAFGVGRDEKHLSPADTSGLALAAIQGLDARLERDLDELRVQNTALADENHVLRQRLKAIEKLIGDSLLSKENP